jgi:hypothetical protein
VLGASQTKLELEKEIQSPKSAVNQPVKSQSITNKQKEADIADINNKFKNCVLFISLLKG